MSCNEASKCFTICVSAESGGGMKAFRKPPPPQKKIRKWYKLRPPILGDRIIKCAFCIFLELGAKSS